MDSASASAFFTSGIPFSVGCARWARPRWRVRSAVKPNLMRGVSVSPTLVFPICAIACCNTPKADCTGLQFGTLVIACCISASYSVFARDLFRRNWLWLIPISRRISSSDSPST